MLKTSTIDQRPIRNALDIFYPMYRYIRPKLKNEYDFWRRQADRIPDQELRKQAQDSLRTKKFHLEGGLIYSAQFSSSAATLVPWIVAYQTISDYLDNLCDRSTSL